MAAHDAMSGMLLAFHAESINDYLASYPKDAVDEAYGILEPFGLNAHRIFSLFIDNDIINATSQKYSAVRQVKSLLFLAAAAPVIDVFWRPGDDKLMKLIPGYTPGENPERELANFLIRFQTQDLLARVNAGLHRHMISDANWTDYSRGCMLTQIMHPEASSTNYVQEELLWLGAHFAELVPHADLIIARGSTDTRFLSTLIGTPLAVSDGAL